jgi:HD-GYP domain-containing protein (c-di-GMP phosphodiesterase class II)
MIQVSTRRLFILILLVQTGCIAVGLVFHHLYISSGIARVQADESRARLTNQSADDGGLVLARAAGDEKVDPAALTATLWAANIVTFLWTTGLLAVTLFMMMVRSEREPSTGQPKLDVEALKQAQALVRAQETVIFGLAKLSDSRDPETGTHLERIAQFSSMLAAELRQRPEFRDRITPGFVQLIGISSALHDIGKVGVEDAILRKPGSLTLDERARMQCHTQIGADCLKEIERRLGSTNFLQMAREIVSAHHEWWNGQGYPLGLVGEQIPLSARIVAVADVYDALRSKRVYKDALPHEECIRLIAGAAGTQFDPRLVEVFLQIEDRFRQLADQLQTSEPPTTALESNHPSSPANRGVDHVSIV